MNIPQQFINKSIVVFIIIILFCSFQQRTKQTVIIDGVYIHSFDQTKPFREATYYYWDNNTKTTIEIKGRTSLLNKMYSENYTLVSTYVFMRGQNRHETWIFEK